MAKTTRKAVYSGLLIKASNGEDYNLLGLVPTSGPNAYRSVIFAEEAEDWSCKHASVRYFISDKPATKEELEEDLIRVVTGVCVSKYGAHYSDLTGYLWTDEEFNVGGHDLIEELKSSIGKFLYMEVEYK